MRTFKDFNRIPKSSIEQFLPLSFLNQEYFKTMGIITGGISLLSKGTVISREKSRGYHILILTISGTGKFIMENGIEYVTDSGQLFFSASDGQGHRHLPVSEKWEICWLQIDRNNNWLISHPDDYLISKSIQATYIVNCFKTIISEYSQQTKNYTTIAELTGQLLLQYIRREIDMTDYSGRNVGYLKSFNRLWSEISKNISYPWDTDAVCEYMNLSKAHLHRLCREFYKMSPMAKIKQIKFEQAYSFLVHLHYTVTEVAELMGYQSTSSFSVAFKNHFNIRPSDLRIARHSLGT